MRQPLLPGFKSFMAVCRVPYSCLLFKICKAYADFGLLVLICL
jgi:hypothetical protein